jgi:7-cyano-7-deazaguanine synthase in queuosine biosynthesis
MYILDSAIAEEAISICTQLNSTGNISTSFNTELLKDVLETSIDCPEKPKEFELKINYSKTELLDEICLTSGGADSTIAWFLANKPKGLYINIGQKYFIKEVTALHSLGISYNLVDISSKFKIRNENWKHIIPGRNFLFLTIAAEMVEDRGNIIFAVTEGEGWDSGKGDKSNKFVCAWQNWYTTVTGKSINVGTLTSGTKASWLKSFEQSGYDIDLIRYRTVTCFAENNGQCGKCQACLRKYLSFISAFGLDTFKDYMIHPMIGCTEYIEKYKKNLKHCLEVNDFSHYSRKRCNEDLTAIQAAEYLIK